MSDAESSNVTKRTYKNCENKNYWGVYWLHRENYSMSRIAEVVGISKSTVQSIIKRIEATGDPTPRSQPGPPKKLNERDIRRLKAIVRKEPFATYDQINLQLAIHDIIIDKTTLIRYLKQIGFHSNSATHKPKLTQDHEEKRLH